MSQVSRFLKRLFRSDDGPTAVEYAVVVALVLLGVVGAVRSVGNVVSAKLQSSANDLSNDSSGSGSASSGSGGSGSSGSGSGSGSSGSGSGGGSGGSNNGNGNGNGNGGNGNGKGKGNGS